MRATSAGALEFLQLLAVPGWAGHRAGQRAALATCGITARGRRDGQSPTFKSGCRVKAPRMKSWMAAADRDLLLSTYMWESIYCNLQVNSHYVKGNGGGL